MAQTKKIAVILSGCGVYDGSEIHEAVLTLLALNRAGAEVFCFAPNIPQHHVVNHLNGEAVEDEVRNVLTEAARIARGKIQDVAKCKVSEMDGVIFPGGYGAAKNLCDFAVEGVRCEVDPNVVKLIKGMHEAKKPMAFLCISPVIAAKVLGSAGVQLTIGNDPATKKAIEEMGAKHVVKDVKDVLVDDVNRIVSTPAYMYDASIAQVAEGIEKCVATVLKLIP
ncbi:MAG: isoprenoid biosynthesis glyoxalase ElbB [Verrucomicrobiae bacterium]|nr:isoprenoid biosynthesis glyoxalase ElbB [Verrucomicrobiae bacterium]